METEIEEWRAIPGYPGYAASSLGRVKSVDRPGWGARKPKIFTGVILKASVNYKGYAYLKLRLDGRNRTHSVSRLVGMAFLDLRDGELVDHIDRDRSNNRLSNLRVASASENAINSKLSRSNKSGVRGVSYSPKLGKWKAMIGAHGHYHYLGSFSTKEEAAAAYRSAAEWLHGDFVSTG